MRNPPCKMIPGHIDSEAEINKAECSKQLPTKTTPTTTVRSKSLAYIKDLCASFVREKVENSAKLDFLKMEKRYLK